MVKFDNQTVVVTGAGGGIGGAIAMGFAGLGAKVIVNDIDPNAAAATCEAIAGAGGVAECVPWDVADDEAGRHAAARIAATHAPVSVLINAAGILRRKDIDADDYLEHWRDVHSVTLDGTMHTMLAFKEPLKQTRGAIVNIASSQSFVALPVKTSSYAAAKGGVAQLTKAFAVEFAAFGVRVNAIAPGFVATRINADTRANPQRMQYFMSRIAMDRIANPDDMVGPVLFLSSPLAAYVTGVVMPVDGGMLAL